MDSLNVLLVLIAAFSLSNAALLPGDLSFTTSPRLDSLLPASVSLNLPAPGDDPSPSNFNPNAIGSDNNPSSSYTPELAQEPSENDAGDDRKFIPVPPSIPDAETQTHIDGANGICSPDSSPGQHRRKRQSTSCPTPAILDFYPNLPQTAQAGGTKLSEREQQTEDMRRKDIVWLVNRLRKRFGSTEWIQKSGPELRDGLLQLSDSEDNSCIKQSVPEGPEGSYPRRFTLCCLGPSQVMTVQSTELRLARRQDFVPITNWFNCQLDVAGRPFCKFFWNGYWKSNSVCCRDISAVRLDALGSVPLVLEPADWWRWGDQGVDCVRHR